MSSPEVERFEITDEDLANEFNPNRRQFRMSKNKAVYGMWADDSDDDAPYSGKGKNKKDYTAPIGFVSGGIKIGDKTTKVEDEEDIPDSESEEERAYVPQPKVKKMRGYTPGGGNKSHGVGTWEKHTKGIGQRLLAKMGHVPGKGLGKNLQGISTPVEAMKRPGRAAVGSYGTERTERSLQDYPKKADSEEEDDKEFQKQLQQWKKDDKKPKKTKYIYKTVDELLSEGPTRRKKVVDNTEMSKVKVIDMTGREQRVLSGYHAIGHKHDRPDDDISSVTPQEKAFDVPELTHNLELLVNLAAEEIIRNDNKLKHEKDLGVNLKFEKVRIDEICLKEEKQISRLEDLLKELEKWQRSVDSSNISLEDCASFLQHLQDDYNEEYRMYDLWALSIAIVFPQFKKFYEGWNALIEPNRGKELLKQWQGILRKPINQPYLSEEAVMEPYERLIWEVWTPPVRRSIAQHWSVRDPGAVIDFFDDWVDLLPSWVLNSLFEQLILPKLQAEVEGWNPLTDTVPIHSWLLPWLPLLRDRLEPLYNPIRIKLASALVNWHPSDPSAKLILQPWKNTWKHGYMEAFIVRNILPKLRAVMQTFVVNPHQQHLDPWNWVMAWLDFVPKQHMITLLLQCFFPRWMQTLVTWMNANPNYDEVGKWYMGWKNMIPPSLSGDYQIQDELKKAVIMMDRKASEHLPSDAYHHPPPPPPPAEPEPQRAASVPTTLKDVVASFAMDKDIEFYPVHGRTYEAKPVYKLGRILVYFDRNVAFMQLPNGTWHPSGVTTLIEKARTGGY